MCKEGFKPQVIWVVKWRGNQVGTVTSGSEEQEVRAEAARLQKVPLEEIQVIDSGARKERCGGCGKKG